MEHPNPFEQEQDRATDPNDLATINEQRYLEDCLNSKKPEGPKATGRCLDPYCDEPLLDFVTLELVERGEAEVPAGTRRFCNAECRDNWEKENSRNALRNDL